MRPRRRSTSRANTAARAWSAAVASRLLAAVSPVATRRFDSIKKSLRASGVQPRTNSIISPVVVPTNLLTPSAVNVTRCRASISAAAFALSVASAAATARSRLSRSEPVVSAVGSATASAEGITVYSVSPARPSHAILTRGSVAETTHSMTTQRRPDETHVASSPTAKTQRRWRPRARPSSAASRRRRSPARRDASLRAARSCGHASSERSRNPASASCLSSSPGTRLESTRREARVAT
mmetsp:Transcript_10409/g.32019  ORF Transcript_10409/g.32019 Transcript_10409/m.32019 type:complete len:239 (+) Transcript_10409:1297-2013(+)